MRQKTIREFEEWKAVPENWAMLIQRVAMGETLKEVCAGQGVAYSLAAKHIASTPTLKAEYDSALQIWADAMAQETVAIADAVEGADEAAHIAAAKLRVETRLKIAGKWDRERYGERDAGQVVVNVNLGDVAREIRALEERLGLRAPVVIDQPAAAALPAPEKSSQGVI